jgi:hypothetical protein
MEMDKEVEDRVKKFKEWDNIGKMYLWARTERGIYHINAFNGSEENGNLV